MSRCIIDVQRHWLTKFRSADTVGTMCQLAAAAGAGNGAAAISSGATRIADGSRLALLELHRHVPGGEAEDEQEHAGLAAFLLR